MERRSLVRGGVSLFISLLMMHPLSAAETANDKMQHGRYLVEHVAMCVQCHTPRTEQGELDRSRLLQRAPMPIQSPFPSQTWAFKAPKIAGLPGGWSEEDMIRLLRTGKGPRGNAPRPPMPPFRMTQEDAAAVAVFLKSLQ
jgi:mono/diheme cytochrome c family protein